MNLSAVRSAAESFRWASVFGALKDEPSASALASRAFRLAWFDRHSSTLADEYRELRDDVLAWCDGQEDKASMVQLCDGEEVSAEDLQERAEAMEGLLNAS
jgi:hypothetical protein